MNPRVALTQACCAMLIVHVMTCDASAVDIDECGTIHIQSVPGGVCAWFETNNGRVLSIDETGGFADGDAVCATGTLEIAACSSSCSTFDGCLTNPVFTPDGDPIAVNGCGHVVEGIDLINETDTCVTFQVDASGESFAIPLSDFAGFGEQPVTGARFFIDGVRSEDTCATTPVLQVDLILSCMIDADLNGDTIVDSSDFVILIGSWGGCNATAQCPADLNADTTVDAVDMAILLANFS